jgi:hypothetical protein
VSRIASPLVVLAFVASLGLAGPAVAQDEESPFSGSFTLDVTNAYFFRGILQEREGVILQPYLDLSYSLYSSEEGFLRGVSVGAGVWGSFHSERTGASDTMGWFYEADYYPVLSLDFAGGVNLTTIYYFYTSPNDAFTTAQELNFNLSYEHALAPWVNIAIETVNTAFGPREGYGLQLGIEPTIYTAPDESVSLSLPVEAGFSLYNYYETSDGENRPFGYASAGLAASIPLTFMPENLGEWSLGIAGKVIFFGHMLEDANRGRSVYPVGTMSLAVAF